MKYQITDGTVTLGGHTVFSHIDFEIRGNEKLAVVGRNGAGKTTLLRLIAGELQLDADDRRVGRGIVTSRRLTAGMLSQTGCFQGGQTVEEFLLEGCSHLDTYSEERYAYETEYDKLFTGLGFAKEDKLRDFSSFSGGEQTKIALIRLLLAAPDILLLDEPTNHLDIAAVEWLERYLKSYEKAVVLVSHDRFFLDRVADAVYELSGGMLRRYAGNYTAYRSQKQKELAIQQKAYDRQQAEIQRLEKLIERFRHKPNKAAFARSRRTMLERMEKLEPPREQEITIFAGTLDPKVYGNKWVFEAKDLKIGYDRPLAELSLRIKRGQKIGIIGDNGAGKTTFLKTMAGLLPPIAGTCELGTRIVPGYFDQRSAAISSGEQVAAHFRRLFPAMTEKEVRKTLASYLFRGSDAAKPVDALSGGEKARLVLCELLTARPNLLLLDEPTNHMDILAKETLEAAFRAYTGTIVFISHDRYFIRQVADAILIFDKKQVSYYPFGYDHYLEHAGRTDGKNLTALVRAEEESLRESLFAVPKAERHEARPLNEEEAYADWQLRLLSESLEETSQTARQLWQQWEDCCKKKQEVEWQLAFGRTGQVQTTSIEKPLAEAYEEITIKEEEVQAALEQAFSLWTTACLNWYEQWQGMGF